MRFRGKYKKFFAFVFIWALLLPILMSPRVSADGQTSIEGLSASVTNESTIRVTINFSSDDHRNTDLLNEEARNLSLEELNRLVNQQVEGDFIDADPTDTEREFVRKENGCGEGSKFRRQEDQWQLTDLVINIDGECHDIIQQDLVVDLQNQENFNITGDEQTPIAMRINLMLIIAA